MYAFTMAAVHTMQILKKYRRGWTVSLPSSSFAFGEDEKLKGKLEKESGNGWQAGIDGSCDVSCHQDIPQLAVYNEPSKLQSSAQLYPH